MAQVKNGNSVEFTITIRSGDYTPPPINPPSFSLLAGSYSETQQVSLSHQDGYNIYYTVDGSTPTSSSIIYNNPIDILENTTIKAISTDGTS